MPPRTARTEAARVQVELALVRQSHLRQLNLPDREIHRAGVTLRSARRSQNTSSLGRRSASLPRPPFESPPLTGVGATVRQRSYPLQATGGRAASPATLRFRARTTPKGRDRA